MKSKTASGLFDLICLHIVGFRMRAMAGRLSFFLATAFLALAFSPTSVHAQCGGFNLLKPRLFQLPGYNSSAMRAVDINNDGVADLVSVLPEAHKISVQLGDGEGGVISTTDFASGSNPTDLELADLDGDGELDVVVTNGFANQFSVLKGDGQGGFTLAVTLSTSSSPYVLELGNFDNDEFVDLAIATGNSVKIYKGGRNFGFVEAGSLPTLSGPRMLVGADFNADGKKDLLLSNLEGNGRDIRVYLGLGENNFQLSATFPTVSGNSAAVMDFDGDTKLDFVVSDLQTSRYLAYKGNMDGTFEAPVITNYTAAQGVASMDYDRDGLADLITPWGVLRGNGSGNFAPFTIFGLPNTAASSVAFADFNSDDLDDFLIVTSNLNPNDSTSVVFNNNGQVIPGKVVVPTGSRGHEVESADFNMDLRPDLVTVDAGTNRVLVLLQAPNGDMVATPASGILLTSGFNVGPYSVTVADLNSDGKADFVVPDSFARKVNVFTGNGDGTFVRTVIDIPANTSVPSFVRTGDFNNDSKLDIISLSDGSRNFYVLLNDGQGGFTVVTPPQSVGSQSGPNKVSIADFTNDGKLDLVVARFFDPGQVFFLGNADGTFNPSPFFVEGAQNITSVHTADYDNDGFKDLAFSSGESNGVFKITFGVGNGGFFNTLVFSVAGSANDLEYGDFDMDGVPDFVVASASSRSVVFYKGRGGRQFDAGVVHYVGPSPAAMTSADFDRDGKRDLAFVTRGIGQGYIVFNTTNDRPCISVGDVQVAEGNAGTTTATVQVNLSAPSFFQTITVDYKTVGRTATAGPDFVNATGTLVFPPGVVSRTIDVTVNGDVLDEDDETIAIALGDSENAAISNGVGVIKVIDDDAAPTLTVGSPSVTEGSGGSTTAVVPVSLSTASARKIRLRLSTQDISATAGQDYLTVTEDIYFNPGALARSVSVPIIPDHRVEPDETLSVNATNLVNVDPPANSGVVTILNDDVGGSVQFSGASYTVAESVGLATITITRTNGNASDIVVQYGTSDGTAVAGQDYTTTSGTVTFGANETSKTFVVPVINDPANEPDIETVNLSISNVTGGATPGTPITALLNIQDDDAGSVFDFDGDGKTDIGIFRPILGASEWWINRSGSGQTFALQFGSSTDRIAPADYTGDGKADIAFFRPASGEWYVLRSEDFSFFALPFGTNGDVPVPADYDADGKADFAVFRPSNSTWFISQSSGAPTRIEQFGSTGDVPVVADYDGDGKADVAIFRQNGAVAEWWINRSTAGSLALQFGANTDKPVQGDYTGDGKADIAIWRPSDGNWLILRSEDFSFFGFPFGANGDVPSPGDYDGDGKFDPTVFRPSNATWFIGRTTAGTQIVQFGATGDRPIPSAFVY